MKLEVTRDVVKDLWPLCRAGEASSDSKTLVDTFLAEDSAYAATLTVSETLSPVVPMVHLSPDVERRLLDDARKRAQTKWLVVGAAVALAGIIALTALGGLLYIMARGL
jgi:hypothetical protein